MTLLPNYQETFVLTQTQEVVTGKIKNTTTSKTLLQNKESANYKFTGWIKGDRFRISLKITRPNNYIPLTIGRIDSTSSGCLVFVNYTLFPITKMFLIFWSLFLIIAGIIASYQYQSVLYGGVSFLLLSIIHWITWSNFKIQLKTMRHALLEILTQSTPGISYL